MEIYRDIESMVNIFKFIRGILISRLLYQVLICSILYLGDNTFVIEWFAGSIVSFYGRKFSFTATR